jgi:hypothetical protein
MLTRCSVGCLVWRAKIADLQMATKTTKTLADFAK